MTPTNGEPLTARELRRATRTGKLKLIGRGLTIVPPEVGQLTDLQTLDLDRNQLTVLPPEIGQLTDLQTLDLRGNQLTVLPPEIGQLIDLLALDVRNNLLTTLPPQRGGLLIKRLTIHLEGNPLRGRIRNLAGRALGTYLRSRDNSRRQAVTLDHWSSEDSRALIITIVGSFAANIVTLLFVGLALALAHRSTIRTSDEVLFTGVLLGFIAAVIVVYPRQLSRKRRWQAYRKFFLIMGIFALEVVLFWVGKAAGIK